MSHGDLTEKTFEHAIADLKLNNPKRVNDMYLLQDMLKLPEDERKEYLKRLDYCNGHLERCWPKIRKESNLPQYHGPFGYSYARKIGYCIPRLGACWEKELEKND